MSFFSKKFPPDIELAKESIKNLLYAKENYSALVNKSGNYLNTELDENINIISAIPNTEHSENKQIDLQIKQIKSQLNRIEEQNNLILEKLKNNN